MSSFAWLALMVWGGMLGSSPQSFGTTYLSNEFDSRKVSVGFAGAVLSLFPLGKVFAYFTFMPLIRRFGRRNVTIFSAALSVATFIATAFSEMLRDDSQFCALHVFFRFLQGACSSWTMTCIQSLAMCHNPAKEKQVIQAQGVGFGLGMSAYAALGSFLFYKFGFQGPAHALAAANLLVVALVAIYVPADQQSRYEMAREKPERTFLVREIVASSSIVVVLISVFASHVEETYIDPTLVPYYKDEYFVKDHILGLLLMFFGLGVLIGAILVIVMQHYFALNVPLLYGNFLLAVSVYLVAPVTHKGNLYSSVAALYITGICDPMIYVPTVPVIYEELIVDYPGHEQELTDYVTVVSYTVIAAGQFMGPIIGSAMTMLMGFRGTASTLGGLILLVAISYLFVIKRGKAHHE